jgi:hypothetical protein
MTRTIRNGGLSVRACNTIVRAFAPDDINEWTPDYLNERLKALALDRQLTVPKLLYKIKNCGYVTIKEILAWAELSPRHVCECRHCGQKMKMY